MTAEELRLRTRRFALEIVELCLQLDGSDFARLVRRQLIRSGTSVAANYRAAGRSRTRREFASKLAVVVEEADESEFWLDLLSAAPQHQTELVAQLRREAIELRAIFSASRATVLRRSTR